MKKNSITIGIDLGDKSSQYCVLDRQQMREASVATTRQALPRVFAPMKHASIAIEVGMHSRWVSRRGPDTDLKRWGTRLNERGGSKGDCGGGAEVGDSAASIVGDGGSVRAVAPGAVAPLAARGGLGSGWSKRRVRATARLRRNERFGNGARVRPRDTSAWYESSRIS